MGWKSTMSVTRKDAIDEIEKRLRTARNSALELALEALVDFDGDPLYGHNFVIGEPSQNGLSDDALDSLAAWARGTDRARPVNALIAEVRARRGAR